MKRLKTLEELVGFGLSSYHVENDQNKTMKMKMMVLIQNIKLMI